MCEYDPQLDELFPDWPTWVKKLLDFPGLCSPCLNRNGLWSWLACYPRPVHEVVARLEIPDEYLPKFMERLACGVCQKPLGLEDLISHHNGDAVLNDSGLLAVGEQYHEHLLSFQSHLAEFPYLGLLHPIAAEIREAIRTAPRIDILPRPWYRARLAEGRRAFSAAEMSPPPAHLVRSEGRFHHFGKRVLYVADDQETAAAEVSGAKASLTWIQEYTIYGYSDLLNLTGLLGDQTLIPGILLWMDKVDAHRTPADPATTWRPEYLISRFVADCAREAGFKGIIYNSSITHGFCMVLFRIDGRRVRSKGQPQALSVSDGEARSTREWIRDARSGNPQRFLTGLRARLKNSNPTDR